MENMLLSYLSFGVDPFLFEKIATKCKNITELEELCAQYKTDCHLGMKICLDDFPPPPPPPSQGQQQQQPPCVVYDFGIREQPEFGVLLSRPPFNCEVHAFDPSPITKKWYETSAEGRSLHDNLLYTLHAVGGGGADETISLREYNWDQVSVYRYPERVLNVNDCNADGACRYKFFTSQKDHKLPVRSVDSLMSAKYSEAKKTMKKNIFLKLKGTVRHTPACIRFTKDDCTVGSFPPSFIKNCMVRSIISLDDPNPALSLSSMASS
jgi:hypothetical protein